MKVYIEKDELYPFFSLASPLPYDEMTEVHGTVVKRWRRVMREFYQVQDEMGRERCEEL